MIAMKMENERVARLHVQHLGESWIDAITKGELNRLEQFCLPDVSSHLLTPKRVTILDNVTDLIAKFQQWFGECTKIKVDISRVERIGERLGIFYRFRLQEDEEWSDIEQQLYCTLENGQVAQLHLLCSGFHPVDMNGSSMQNDDQKATEEDLPTQDAVLELLTELSESGSTCAVLTPMIRAKLRELQSGQVLEVHVNDPTAQADVEAWSRLSGNVLLKVIENGKSDLRFFIKKK